MLEKHPGVAVAMPFADRELVEVWATKPGALSEKTARAMIESQVGEEKFVMNGFVRVAGSAAMLPD